MFERFFFDDDGTLVDRTIEWSNQFTALGSWDAKSYLYISSFFPFNHKYIDIDPSNPNDQAGTLSIDVWYNNEWTSVVDILDYTKGTNSLEQSGNIFFTQDEDKGWDEEDDSSDISELSTTKVYSAYWMRIGYTASTDSALKINYIGHKFCDDDGLFSYYPLLNNSSILTRFKSGKTTWDEQQISASKAIINDLRGRNLILSKDQILDAKRYEIACIHKTAEIIFSGMPDAYEDQRILAKRDYKEAMNSSGFPVDINADGKQDRSEIKTNMVRLGR